MKFIAKTLLLTAAMATAGLAHAQLSADATITAGGRTVGGYGFALGYLQGSGSLAFSQDLIGALGVAGIETSIVAPAAGVVDAEVITIGAPILSVSGTFTAHEPEAPGGGPVSFTANKVATLGGATMVAPKANFATSGGSLTVTNITVDLSTQGIYATVSGAHGLTEQTVRVWNYAQLEGDTTFNSGRGSYVANNKLTGLTITEEAFDLFAQGLGLKPGGIAAMASIANYGVMTSSLNMSTPLALHDVDWVATIPEPSTYALMAVGLVGVLLTTTQRRRAA